MVKEEVKPVEELKVDLNQVVEACMKQLQVLQANKKQSKRPRSARKRLRCWCCGEKGHLPRACPVVQQNRAANCKQKAEKQRVPDSARGCQMVSQDARGCQMMQKGARGCQRVPDGARGCQIVPESARGCQRVPDGARGCQMVPEGARGCQRVPEGPDWDGRGSSIGKSVRFDFCHGFHSRSGGGCPGRYRYQLLIIVPSFHCIFLYLFIGIQESATQRLGLFHLSPSYPSA